MRVSFHHPTTNDHLSNKCCELIRFRLSGADIAETGLNRMLLAG